MMGGNSRCQGTLRAIRVPVVEFHCEPAEFPSTEISQPVPCSLASMASPGALAKVYSKCPFIDRD